MPRRDRQLSLSFPRRGGARTGAGRKPSGERAGVSHHGRPKVRGSAPVHVTMRVLPHVWNLRSQRSLAVVHRALEGMKTWSELRIVHFAVLGDHLHFIVEADGGRALSEGMQGLSIRLAKGLNRMMGRRGKVFTDRFHAHVLATPAEVRNALAYVLLNHRSHMARNGERVRSGALDQFSSAAAFEGWKEIAPEPASVTSPPGTWLLRTGWRRRGLLSTQELPRSTRNRLAQREPRRRSQRAEHLGARFEVDEKP